MEGSRRPGPRRTSNATPSAFDAKPAPKAKPSDAERHTAKQVRAHYHRLFRHIDELKSFITYVLPDPAIASRESWQSGRQPGMRAPGVQHPDSVRYDSFARELKELERGLGELLGDLRAEDWTPALLERCYREAALAAFKKEVPVLEAKAQSGRLADARKLATARNRLKKIDRDAARRGAR